MPFAERNPPDIAILPGPDYRYTINNPPAGGWSARESRVVLSILGVGPELIQPDIRQDIAGLSGNI